MKLPTLLFGVLGLAVHVSARAAVHSVEALSRSTDSPHFDPRDATSTLATPKPAATHIDTLNSTWGVATNAQIRFAKHRTFCTSSAHAKVHCAGLRAHVQQCIDPNSNDHHDLNLNSNTTETADCKPSSGFDLMRSTIDLNPCLGLGNGDVGQVALEICERWRVEAKRCRDKKKRGPCSEHHVGYLLKVIERFLVLGESG